MPISPRQASKLLFFVELQKNPYYKKIPIVSTNASSLYRSPPFPQEKSGSEARNQLCRRIVHHRNKNMTKEGRKVPSSPQAGRERVVSGSRDRPSKRQGSPGSMYNPCQIPPIDKMGKTVLSHLLEKQEGTIGHQVIGPVGTVVCALEDT